jgi:hypothetical protein
MGPKTERQRPAQHPITVSEGFIPQALPELTPPVAGAQPWTWLAESTMPAEERAAYLGRFVSGHGTVDPLDRHLALQPRSRREVITGHLRQHVFFDLPGDPAIRVRLSSRSRPVREGTPDSTGGGFPFEGPVAVVGTTVPVASAGEVAGRQLGEEMADFLTGRGIESCDGVATNPRREWVDRALVVDYTDGSMVRLVAQVHMQPFLTVWRSDPGHPEAGVLEVIDLSDSHAERVVASRAADVHQVSARTCPLIPGSGCGDLCTMYGGPWGSRAITAAARWEERRARMIRALGCDTCGDGAVRVFTGKLFVGGRATIPIRPDTSTPTRHDRLVVVEAEEDAGGAG